MTRRRGAAPVSTHRIQQVRTLALSVNDDDPILTPQPDAEQSLRLRAEHKFGPADDMGLDFRTPEEIRRLVHELRVHQIELETQNDELRRTQHDLDRARARYFDLYDMAPVGYFTLSESGLIQEANLTAVKILQVPRGELVRRSLALFIIPEDQDRYYLHRRQLIATGTPQVCEVRIRRPDRTLLWARMETTVAQSVDGGEVVHRTVMSDITVRAQAEEDLRKLNATLEQRVDARTAALRERDEQFRRANAELARSLRLKDEFLSMMSHELRTPLNTILLITESLLADLYGQLTERQHQLLSMITQSGRHLLALISDILDLTRIVAGKESLDPHPTDVESLCTMALMLIQPVAKAKGITVRHVIAPGITTLRADERRLTQVLVNLLNNALKFTPAGGSVGLDVAGDVDLECIQFSVWDTGIGITRENLSRLFEPFTQIDGRLSREYEGVGLGLTLVHRLVDLHGGSVSLVSAPGQGSRFTVSLPWSEVENRTPAAVEVLMSMPIAKAKHPLVLIADDHETTLTLYADLLSMRGYQVATARSGDESIAQVRATRPDIVVMDIQMPGMDGFTAIRNIRGDPEIGGIPIIALTALAMPGDRERCLAAGATIYLAKPVSLRILLTTIADLLG